MLVKNFMVVSPLTVGPQTLVVDAQKIMERQNIRCLPVVDKKNRLLGLVTRHTLREAQPSKATTLSRREVDYLLSKLKVGDIMIKNPFTCLPDTPLDEAASLMERNRIGHLPVVDEDERLVGIITVTDLLRSLADALGVTGTEGLRRVLGTTSMGLRISLEDVPLRAGEVKKVVNILASFDPIIYSFLSLLREGKRTLVFRIETREPVENIREKLEAAGYKVGIR